MNVIVDGAIYQLQPEGGISRVFREILPRMCSRDPSLRVTLLTEEGQLLSRVLPQHARIVRRTIPRVERHLRPRRLWGRWVPELNRLARKLWIGPGKGKIWHSTYFTLPENWVGMNVVTVHDMIYELFPDIFFCQDDQWFREQKRRCVRAADRVICVSETTRDDMQSFYGINSAKIRVVPNGYDDIFEPLAVGEIKFDSPSGNPFLLYVGHRYHYKNFLGLLNAYANWPIRKDMDLIAVGGGQWNMDERQLLTRLGIGDRVHLLGYVDDQTLSRLYNGASALVYPSLYEGFGIPLLEAMACGCPVVASRIPSTVEIAGDCPIYFESGDLDSLIDALNTVLGEGRGSTRCLAGLKEAKKYSWDITAKKTLDVYRDL